ncbi:hypothetical protein P9Z80_13690 [Bacillus cereus]|nr:hypothetical protein [Bacillus cereus]MEC3260903.1 hypothetical protein [Bacillus cereus]
MSKTLQTFMMIAITAIICITLYIGYVYVKLEDKNNKYQNNIQNYHQLKKVSWLEESNHDTSLLSCRGDGIYVYSFS